LSRFASQVAGIATVLSASIRRPPILDADEAEERSFSSDQFDNGLPSASREPQCRGTLNPEGESAALLELGMVSPEPELGMVSPEPMQPLLIVLRHCLLHRDVGPYRFRS